MAVGLAATVASYIGARALYGFSGRHPLLLPVITATLVISSGLWALDIDIDDYTASVELLSWLLQPVVVLLAVPIYIHFEALRRDLPDVLTVLLLGSCISIASVLGLALLLALGDVESISALSKSVTSPVSMPLADAPGGDPILAGGLSILTGIIATPMSLVTARFLGLSDAQTGVLLGLNAHAVGSAKAADLGMTPLAYSAFSMAAASLMFAVILPAVHALTG